MGLVIGIIEGMMMFSFIATSIRTGRFSVATVALYDGRTAQSRAFNFQVSSRFEPSRMRRFRSAEPREHAAMQSVYNEAANWRVVY